MSPKKTSEEKKEKGGLSPTLKLTLLVIPLILLATGWYTWQHLQTASTRQAGVILPPNGLVTVQLTTEPFPPIVGGPVLAILDLEGSGGFTPRVDEVVVRYGPVEGSDDFEAKTVFTGAAAVYQSQLQFTEVGDWWVEVTLTTPEAEETAQFTLPVRPAM